MMQALYKYAKNFVGDGSRPVYEGIYFDGKSACVTNSHIMLVIKDYPLPKRLVHYKTGRTIEGNFPDYGKAIPSTYQTKLLIHSPSGDLDAGITKWQKAVKVAMEITKGESGMNVICFKWDGKALTMQANNEDRQMIFTCTLPAVADGESAVIETTVNAKYVIDTLGFFKDCDPAEVRIKITSSGMMVFESDQAFVIITPIRIYRGA